MKYLALTIPGANGQPLQVQAPKGVPQGGLATSGGNIIAAAIQILLLVAVLLGLFYIIYGGFKWMTSGGDQEKLSGARSTIMYAIIGVSISVLSFFIVNVIGHFFDPNWQVLNIEF